MSFSDIRDAIEESRSAHSAEAFSALLLYSSTCSSACAWALRLAHKLAHNIALKLHGHEHDLAACGLRHRLQSLELPDLHGSGTGENICCLSHEACSVDFGTGGDDLRLSDPLLLGGGRERGSDLRGEDDVFDEDALNGNTPLVGDVAHNFGNLICDRLALGHDALHSARTDDMSQGRLCTFNEGLTKIRDTEGSAIWVCDLEVDDGVTGADDKMEVRKAELTDDGVW